MISKKKLKELKESTEAKTQSLFTDEEWKVRYDSEVKSILVPTPARYRDVTAEDVPVGVIERFLEKEGREKNGLYIWGGVGTGKTHILYAIRAYWAERLMRFRIVNVSELFADIKKSFGTDNVLDVIEEGSYYQGFDDIGTEKDTEWAGEQMYRLVNRFYEHKKYFVFTSNLSLKELAGRFGEQGDRIASRIAEMCEVIEIKGNDRRV